MVTKKTTLFLKMKQVIKSAIKFVPGKLKS